ncbi:hypothetical protein D3C85_1656410 [compost metagenome]
MILELADKYHISLADSYTIGDMDTDIKAGKLAGTKTIRLGIRTERTKNHAIQPEKADHQTTSLWKAVQWILEKETGMLKGLN